MKEQKRTIIHTCDWSHYYGTLKDSIATSGVGEKHEETGILGLYEKK